MDAKSSIKYIKCKISGAYINNGMGNHLSWYGHLFIVNPEKTEAHCYIPEYLARQEAAMGRYRIDESAPAIEKQPAEKPASILMSNPYESPKVDLGTYYGCGDLENFRKRLVGMERPEIVEFATKTMNLNMEFKSYKNKLVDELCMIMETKIAEAAAGKKE